MKRCDLLVLVFGSVLVLPTCMADLGELGSEGSAVSAHIGCAQEILFGRLIVTDASTRTFILQGYGVEFHAPPGVDVSAFDGALVRVDFDTRCSVRTIVRAERLEGPTIEA